MSYALKLVTAPTGDVVALQDIKQHLRIDYNEEDLLLKAYIASAVERAERCTGRRLLTQTWGWYMDAFPNNTYSYYVNPRYRGPNEVLYLPLAPLATVDFIKYYDDSNALQTWSSANYEIDQSQHRARISPVAGISWPSTYQRLHAVQIQLTVGYGAASSIPAPITQWILASVAESYKNRELTIDRAQETMSTYMEGLLDHYVVPEL